MIIDFRIIGTGEEFWIGGYDALPAFMERYKQLYDFKRLCTLPFEGFLREMNDSGVSLAVLHAEYAYGDVHLLNETVATYVKKYPDRLIGFAGVDPLASNDPVSDLDRYVKQWSMKGLNLQPWVQGWYANAKRLFPLYSYCQEKGLRVAIHASLNFATDR